MASVFSRLLHFDSTLRETQIGRIAGVDEAGRGPLAGPVVAASVIFIRKIRLSKLNDSKKLSAPVREELCQQILQNSIVGIGLADEAEIDLHNIYEATRMAMRRAILALSRTPDLLLIDGTMRLDLPLPQKAVVDGDAKSASIAAASIVAKVYRDAWMFRLHEQYPDYQFNDHKGYGTPAHLKKIQEIGPSPVHRKSFSPVTNYFSHEAETV